MPFGSLFQTIQKNALYNYSTFTKTPLAEISGSLGDLGTLLPLLVALSNSGAISLSSTLVFSGLSNILSGAIFGVPIVVQPMKAIAAITLARGLSQSENMAAGLGVAAVVLLLSVTGLLSRTSVAVPIPIIKGIQAGAGLSLILNAGSTLTKLHFLGNGLDNLLAASITFVFLSIRINKLPFALIVFLVGIIASSVRLALEAKPLPVPGIWSPFALTIPSPTDFSTGFLTASLGQVPLTVLNSIIAVTHLSSDLLPERPPPSPTALGFSVAGMNLVGCIFGAMPVCHGSGGLAGQYHFGARSGASVIFLGIFKLVVGLVFGPSLTGMLASFPHSLLGVMVFAAGVELVSVAEDLNTGAMDVREREQLTKDERKKRWVVFVVTVGAFVAFRSAVAGVCAGGIWWAVERIKEKMEQRRHGERQPLLRRT